MDAEHAHVSATAEQSDELFALFHGSGVTCNLERAAIGDLDMIDFGRPSATDRKRIRACSTSGRNETRNVDGATDDGPGGNQLTGAFFIGIARDIGQMVRSGVAPSPAG